MRLIRKMAQRVENRLAPWVQRRDCAHREAIAAAHEADLIRSRRPLVEKIVFELGVHQRENHFVDIIHRVAKGSPS
jgi:hypothetical protein